MERSRHRRYSDICVIISFRRQHRFLVDDGLFKHLDVLAQGVECFLLTDVLYLIQV